MDHRHRAIWMWTHHSSLTDNSETSIESSFSDNSDAYRMGDSPRLLPSLPGRLGSAASGTVPISGSASTSSPSIMPPHCSPSTSFASPSSVMELSSSLLTPSLLATLSSSFLRSPPPPYTPRAHHHHTHPSHEALFRMHNTPVILEPECDIDVVGLSDSTKEVSLYDRLDVQTEVDEDQPLDLSLRRSPAVSPASRPSVIIEGLPRPTSSSQNSLRRTVSSASSIPDVRDHFRRSLSGKWPRRTKTEDERGRASPLRRHTSFNHSTSTATAPVVIKTTTCDIEDHFRRALGGPEFDAWKRKREEASK